jgi:parvulin-like peptidyl-prolyl isomerase
MRSLSKRTVAAVFAVVLAALVVLVAATMGIGKPSVPEGAVAFVDGVDGGEISQEELDSAIEQAAASQQIPEVPAPGDPAYATLLVPAVSDVLLSRWVAGEAEERGIEVTEREIDAELETIIEEQFGGQQEFDDFLEESGFTEEEARQRVSLQLQTQCIQDKVIPQDPEAEAPATQREGCQGEETLEITDQEIQDFYDENISSFETPETRDVRTLLNPDESEAEQAVEDLGEDPDEATWKDVTKELSTDDATKDLGGLRPGVAPGQNEPALDDAIFSAEVGEVVGPIETEAGFYVIEVEAINEAATQELDEATAAQIRQQLVTQKQQAAVTEFQETFVSKWQSRTVCSDDLLANDPDGTIQSQLAERCSNFEVTDDGCQGDDEGEEAAVDQATGEEIEGCGAFVVAPPVIAPVPLPQDDEATVPALTTPGGALPQGPQQAPSDEEPAAGAEALGLPPGALPPGAAPPGAAPPGAAPPAGAPPGAAPPGAAPPPQP